ncbi:MAG: imelysin family protein [Gammaproteobacteria bacterium]|nr:imelysin family protein [Gammaproteobacteria bacterium]
MNTLNRPGLHSILGVAALLAACERGPAIELSAAAPPQVVEAVVQGVALPGFEHLTAAGKTLEESVSALCERPDAARLASAREAWRRVNTVWRAQRPLMFGPARDAGLLRRIDLWPTHELMVDAAIRPEADRHTRNEPSARGLAAAEMLLFGDRHYPADEGQWSEPARCLHMADIGAEITGLTNQMANRWKTGYGPALLEGEAMAVLSLVMAEILNTVEGMLWQRVGVPANFFRGDPRPEQLEAWRSGQSLAGIAASLRTIEVLLAGDAGAPGIASLLIAEQPRQARGMVRASRAALASADAITPPLRDALNGGRTRDLFDAIQDLKNALLDSAALLGLTIAFESDGD